MPLFFISIKTKSRGLNAVLALASHTSTVIDAASAAAVVVAVASAAAPVLVVVVAVVEVVVEVRIVVMVAVVVKGSITTTRIIIMIIIIIAAATATTIRLKGAIGDFFHNLLTAPRAVSNTHTQLARAQSCTNHVQHRVQSRATSRVPLGTKGQLSY